MPQKLDRLRSDKATLTAEWEELAMALRGAAGVKLNHVWLLAASCCLNPSITVAKMPALCYGLSKLLQQSLCVRPPDAGIRNALPVDMSFAVDQRLRACDEVALDHHADDASVSAGDLLGDIAAHGVCFRKSLPLLAWLQSTMMRALDAGRLHLRRRRGDEAAS